MMYRFVFIRLSVILASIFFTQAALPKNSDATKVNVFTWWGYLASPWVSKMILDECNVQISYDEYYTNDEFMRRFHVYKELYDIVIFPGMDYQSLKYEMRNSKSKIYKNSENYETVVRLNYKKNHYQHNIAYFLLSYNLFLYNPSMINLSKDDAIEEIFKKAQSTMIVLSDEPIYLQTFLHLKPHDTNLIEALSQFSALTKNTNILLTNNLSPAYSDPTFSFAFTWPGIALYAMSHQYKNYHFLLHPKYSLVSADLIAELNDSPNTQCVSRVMTSKKFLSRMQNDALYFSPYGDSDSITDKNLKHAHQQFFEYLPKLKWYKAPGLKEYGEMNRAWNNYFKLHLNDQKK